MEMADSVTFKFEGFQEFTDMVTEIREDFGEKDAKNIMNKAMRLAMEPVLSLARNLVPVDSGALQDSLRIEARKPTSKDKHSRYVNATDVVIATVTTAPASAMKKKGFNDFKPDFRALAMEFGTAKIPGGKPFLRPALEGQSQAATNVLTDSLRTVLERYKSKYNK